MRDNYTLKQELTFAEYLAATIYISIRIKIVKRIFFFGIAIGILSGLLNILIPAKQALPWDQAFIQFIIVPLFMICFFTIILTITTAILYKRMARHFNEITFYFNHWGIEKRGNRIDFTTPWKKVLKMKETNKFLFLYIGENVAYILQKRMFDTAAECEEFKALIDSKLS